MTTTRIPSRKEMDGVLCPVHGHKIMDCAECDTIVEGLAVACFLVLLRDPSIAREVYDSQYRREAP